MSRILVTGASGFIGKPLTFFLKSNGHEVIAISHPNELIDPIDFDAVIHLAGEPLALGRWSKAKRERILKSRIEGTAQLCRQLEKAPPKVFISASAVGFYGDRGEELLTEESGAGAGFLSTVCKGWERASAYLKTKGVRVVHARFGIVLGPHGGVLAKMVPVFKLGLGGKIGRGEQWISWIALEDLIRILDHLLQSELAGPVNVCAPESVRQLDFAKTLAEELKRPTWGSVPAWIVRAVLGDQASELLLASAKATPAKLLDSNFAFLYSDLRSALKAALKIDMQPE